jgi:hypothetical protein
MLERYIFITPDRFSFYFNPKEREEEEEGKWGVLPTSDKCSRLTINTFLPSSLSLLYIYVLRIYMRRRWYLQCRIHYVAVGLVILSWFGEAVSNFYVFTRVVEVSPGLWGLAYLGIGTFGFLVLTVRILFELMTAVFSFCLFVS